MDAAQGVEAQTLANVYLALDHDLDVMPVINKIDLPSAQPDEVIQEIEDVIGIEAQDAPRISAKTGLNIDQVLEQIVTKIPAPTGDPTAPLKALIFDALYDSYKGVIVFCRIKEGTVKVGDRIRMMATGAMDEVTEVGYFGAGQFIPCDELSAGMVGYICASIKNVRDTRVYAAGVPVERGVQLSTRSVMGVELPTLKLNTTSPLGLYYDLESTNGTLDVAYLKFNEVKTLTVELAEVEISVIRLAEAIQKTQKRANALGNVQIPQMQRTIKSIDEVLSEREREEFSRLKVIKAQKEKEEA